jgi:hypothetical protein
MSRVISKNRRFRPDTNYTGSLAFPADTAGHAADAYYGPNFSVPDGGLTAGLLGGALVGIGALRRKLAI